MLATLLPNDSVPIIPEAQGWPTIPKITEPVMPNAETIVLQITPIIVNLSLLS